MLTLPDFKQKQVLFIQANPQTSNKIKFRNDNIVLEQDDKIADQVSCHRVFAVFVLGNASITSELMRRGLEYGVSFFFLKNNFNLYAAVNAQASGNYLLRMRQYGLAPQEELFIAKKIVANKIMNQRRLLKSRKKNLSRTEEEITQDIAAASGADVLLGIEGNISKEFFGAYFDGIGWTARMPRTKLDIPNFLLDMGYTTLFNFTDALLNLFGFDTYKGCYHKLFFQRKSLSCDIMEPFRCIVDREVLKIFNLNIFNESDFRIEGGQAVLSFANSKKYAAVFLEAIMKQKEEIYSYVREFYSFLMNNQGNPWESDKEFPDFKMPR